MGYPEHKKVNYMIEGPVVHGRGEGRKYGMPTANIDVGMSFEYPPFGVYGGTIEIEGNSFMALTNVGIRPSVDDTGRPTIEAHILDFDRDIYGKSVKLNLTDYVRGTRRFEGGLSAVKTQLDKDILYIRGIDHSGDKMMKDNEIYKIYGTDYKEMTKALLRETGLCKMIPEGAYVGIKPNLVSCVPAEYGSTTHTEVVAGIIEYLQESGTWEMAIAEGSWVGDKTSESFEMCGYNALSEKYGVPLMDMQKEDFYEAKGPNGKCVKVCTAVQKFDFLINVPVLKGHCQTNITCALKNMKGLIPNSEKRRFHSLGLHEPIAILNTAIKQNFIVVDHICGDLDSEDGGNPYYSNCIMAALDPVLMDSYVCSLMGYGIEDVPYIGMAEEFGVGSSDLNKLEIHYVNLDGGNYVNQIEVEEKLPVTHRIFRLREKTQEVETCSACYESLMEALCQLEDEGLLSKFNEKICIGQGYRNKEGMYGIGNCTGKFKNNIPGCPPKSEEIYKGIRKWIMERS